MAPKVSPRLSYVFLFLSLVFSHAKLATGEIPSSSSLDFFKQLQGSKKGDKVEGLYNLKKYLKTFGYIDDLPHNSSSPEAGYFSDQLESAVRTYQTNYHLNSTGVLDIHTLSQLTKPRCGVPDIINGTNWMMPPDIIHRRLGPFEVVSHYAFFNGKPKWPNNKNVLTYGFADGTPAKFFIPVTMAFVEWSKVSHFSFKRTDYKSADLKFHLFAGAHGDGQPFDGPGGILAHAFAPTIGICHFDSTENWAQFDPAPNAMDIQSVALHEIGHLLGLAHTPIRDAVMWPDISPGVKKRALHDDDIRGIRALYPFIGAPRRP